MDPFFVTLCVFSFFLWLLFRFYIFCRTPTIRTPLRICQTVSGHKKTCILIFGANGFVGAYVVRAFRTAFPNIKIVACDITSPPESTRYEDVVYVTCNAASARHVSLLFKHFQPLGVVSLVAVVPSLYLTPGVCQLANVDVPKNLFNCLAKHNPETPKFFVHTSSATCVLAANKDFSGNEDVPFPPHDQQFDMYTRAKRDVEEWLQAKVEEHKKVGGGPITVHIMRPAAVFGPGDRVLTDFLLTCDPRNYAYIGTGEYKQDYIDAWSVADAYRASVATLLNQSPSPPTACHTYFVSSNFGCQYTNLVMGDCTGKASKSTWQERLNRPTSIPLYVFWVLCLANEWSYFLTGRHPLPSGLGAYSINYVTCSYAFENNRALKELGWKPLYSVQEGFDKCREEFAARAKLRHLS
eukprot:Platyproteum_vivax@DN6047_c0_g1_i1.p1